MKSTTLLATCALTIAASFSQALADDSDKKSAITDPQKAGVEYSIQGEYQGTVNVEGKHAVSAQVIAMGDGQFELVSYRGKLPGVDNQIVEVQNRLQGELADGAVTFESERFSATIKDGKISVIAKEKEIGSLSKVVRKSPTQGAKPPKGAIVLFDGSSPDSFENGSLIEGKYLGAANSASKQKFGDHRLHIEFRTPFMPKARGQGRGNSGVYITRRYEVQVLDSFGLKGLDNECGGIYKIAEPAQNMCYPPLQWQTYDIEFTAAKYDDSGKKLENARATIRHNGFVIHDDLELPKNTPGQHVEGPEKDSLFLQNHSNPVVFRNIWVVEK